MGRTRKVTTDSERLQRLLELEQEEKLRQQELEESKKNKNFAQVYSDGWEKIREFVIDKQPTAVRVYTFLAEHMDANTGAVVASHALLAENMGVSTRTIINVLAYLEKKKALIKINLGKGTVQAYCLNPELVWKSFNSKKPFAAFYTKTLARSLDNGEIRRKLKMMMKELPPEAESDFEEDKPDEKSPYIYDDDLNL